MNKSFEEADDLVNDIMTKLEEKELGENTLMILCPPFPYLEMCQDYSNDSYFAIGAQNVNDNEKGAYTGEVSATMLSSMEIEYCIVGHSERRAYYGETDAIVARKVDRLLENDIRPIVCCGEVLEEREAGKQFEPSNKRWTLPPRRRKIRSDHYSLRTCMGHWNRQNRHTRAGTGNTCLHTQPHSREIRQRGGRQHQHPLWRQLQTIQRPRALRQPRCRRWPHWWRITPS